MMKGFTPNPIGLLLIVSGPAGSGKTTLCERMLAEEPGFARAVTATTRKPRVGETDKVDYHFYDQTTFEAKIQAGEFYEYAQVHGNFYGTLKSEIQDRLEAGTDLLLNIDVQGAAAFREEAKTDTLLKKRLVTVFIMPPSINELEQRLQNRATDDNDEIQRRLKVALEEMKQCDHYDHCLNSTSREEDFEKLRSIYLAEKVRIR